MALLSKTVTIRPNGRSIAYYKSKGYDVKKGSEIEVKIEDLSSGSGALVETQCDYCGKIKPPTRYVDYMYQTKNGTEKCCCKDCAHIKYEEAMVEKYGCKAPIQNPEIKNKIQETNISKYGSISPAGNAAVREKQKETSMNKYGVEYPIGSKEVRDKIKQTNLDRYGFENPLSNDDVRKKIKETNLKKYGVENVLLNQEIKEKRNNTLIEKFGTLYPLQNKECYEKLKETNLEKYGVENVSQVKKVRQKVEQTCLDKYGVKNILQNDEIKEKIKNTNLKKYGVEYLLSSPEFHAHSRVVDMERYGVYHHLQNKEILAKQKETFYKNGNCPTSNQQKYLHHLYKGEMNYPLNCYNIDICFPDEKLCIEYDGGGHSLGVKLGGITQKEFDRKEIIRDNIIKRNGYKQMKIISSTDKLPSDDVLLKMLSDARRYFIDYPNHSWIEFNIDNSTVRNAENKNGISYEFGILRRITQNVE